MHFNRTAGICSLGRVEISQGKPRVSLFGSAVAPTDQLDSCPQLSRSISEVIAFLIFVQLSKCVSQVCSPRMIISMEKVPMTRAVTLPMISR